MKDVIIVDNCPTAYVLTPDVALPIKTWVASDLEDRQLLEYIPLLKKLS